MQNPKTPQLSIIVPVYNVEAYIPRCLDSICAQTFADWECICVDDGSTDRGGGILDEYAARDSRFIVIHKENEGLASARNTGLDAARGEFIGFVDSDDWIEAETYELAIEAAKRHDVDIVQWGNVRETEDGPILYKEKPAFFFGFGGYGDDTVRDSNVWAKLFRRAFLAENGLRFLPGIRYKEDFYFSLVAYGLCKKGAFIDRALYHYDTMRQTSLVHNVREAWMQESEAARESEVAVMRKIERMIKEQDVAEIAGGGVAEFLFKHKFFIKRKALLPMPQPDYELFRKTFPELNREMLPRFIKERTKTSFVRLLAAWRLGWIAEAIFWAKRKMRRLAGRQ